ncbi:anthranilate phosphoribosyltransferase [Sutterella sp.]|uniref:anthranilate phosphoribosyltransferase n=1 Tax=Sutterella sp. TaxID=1981025 RepID=UPI0026DFFAE4|nr:anthranilate phosphoribosyltransferase [Sutterella sp.]MDO5531328.1 anthranilate phosphoribosyltransferase [Sutterella sp.]
MQSLFESLYQGKNLSAAESERIFTAVFEGSLDPVQLSALLTALKIKGETPEEIEGAARAMVKAATPFPRPAGFEIGEIVGTGGDGLQTINVSTTTSMIAAAGGLHIAKHGNRGVSSKSGASDVLTALGVNIRPTPEQSAKLLADTGFCFCFAQLYHPAMRFAGPVRASLKTRTIFNILGPLTNPAHPDFALIGVYDPALLTTVAKTLKELGVKRGFVVHGAGMDEVAVHGDTAAVELAADGSIRPLTFTPADFGVTELRAIEDLQGGDPEDNAEITLALLSGKGTPAQQDFIRANLAVLLLAGGKAATLPDAVALARELMQSGAGLKTLEAHRAFARAQEAA